MPAVTADPLTLTRLPRLPEQETAWRCWLGHNGRPAPSLPLRDRTALIGGGAVLAAEDTFLAASLYPRRAEECISLDLGTPLAQIAAEGWWVGWSRQNDRPILWTAPIPGVWRNLDVQPIPDA